VKKIALYLMGFKGLACLQAIVEADKAPNIVAVIGSKDEAIQNDYYAEIELLCQKAHILFLDRKQKNNIAADIAIAVSWRWIIPVSNSTPLIVFHDSLLPKYRGFAPLVNCLINGEKKVGVTALFASDEYDKGNIIMQESIDVQYPIKIEKAIADIATCYTTIMLQLIHLLEQGNDISATPQNEAEATYSLWLNDNDYTIHWQKSATEIKRFIDSVGYPYNGAATTLHQQKVIILDAEECEDVMIENRTPGKVIFVKNNLPVIVCGKGLLKITSMQSIEGQPMLPLKNFRSQFI
jgi:methionyl-tRNA formyltransferase